MNGRCPRGEDLSALLDQALSTPARERVQRHLLDCAPCRSELADLRRLRALMSTTRHETPSTTGLADRLVGIAGADATTPLSSLPFSGVGELPTRQRRQRRVLVLAAVLATTFVALTGIGWAAAPPLRVVALTPEGNRGELAGVLADLPLGVDVMAALVAVDDPSPLTSADTARGPRWDPAGNTADSWDNAEALAALQRAARSRHTVAVEGRQEAWVATGQGSVHALAAVQRQPSQGAEITVTSGAGRVVAAGYLPAADESAGLPARHLLSGTRNAGTLHGHRVSVVEARAEAGGPVLARWWLDAATGLVVWQTVTDPSGALLASSGFTSWTTSTDTFVSHLPARVATSPSAELSLTARGGLTAAGWSCAGELGGLPLVRLSGMSSAVDVPAPDPEATDDVAAGVRTVYSDGIHTVVVSQQRGALAGAPDGFTWDPALRGYRRDGAATEVIWQSGNRVFSVSAVGGSARLAEVVGLLPHDAPVLRTRSERVWAGWHRIFTGR